MKGRGCVREEGSVKGGGSVKSQVYVRMHVAMGGWGCFGVYLGGLMGFKGGLCSVGVKVYGGKGV